MEADLVTHQAVNLALLECRYNTPFRAKIDYLRLRVPEIKTHDEVVYSSLSGIQLAKWQLNTPRVEAGFECFFPFFGRWCFLRLRCKSLLRVAEKTNVCMLSLLGDRSSAVSLSEPGISGSSIISSLGA